MVPKVSIIVPCYNSAKFINSCIKAIAGQAYKDYELILVNDGSTDGTAEILDSLPEGNIRVIHKPNGGVSSARNAGLEVAKGEWIMFVDVDDKIKSDGLESMLSLASNDCDIVFAGYEMYDNKELKNKIPTLRESVAMPLMLARELFAPTDYNYLGFPWAKLFRRSVIEDKHIRFNEAIKYNEDRLFTFTFLSYAKKGAYTTKPVYEYNLHGGNAMAAIEGPNFWKFETDLDAFVEMSNIAPRFNSTEITRLVRLGSITSYRWNQRLNRQYDNNNAETNTRLKAKLYSVITRQFWLLFRLSETKAAIKYKLKKILK